MEQEEGTLNVEVSTNFFYKLEIPMIKNGEEVANYACYICKKTFYNVKALQNHKSFQHDLLEFNPEYKREQSHEDITVQKDDAIKETHYKNSGFMCVKLDEHQPAPIKLSKLNHMIKSSQPRPEKIPVDFRGPFTCSLPSNVDFGRTCEEKFPNCCDYSLHYRDKHTKRRKAVFRCQVCEKHLERYPTSTITYQQLETHNVSAITCSICGLSFFNSYQCEEHKRVVHAKIKPYQCTICAKRFMKIYGLQQHMRLHNGIKPFVCRFCDKAFTQKAGVDQHLRTHTKVKPYKCVICSKCFTQSVHLSQHMRTHTNIQPYRCEICKKTFKQSAHLKLHRRSHLNVASTLRLEQYSQVEPQQTSNFDYDTSSNVQAQERVTLYYQLTPETSQHHEPLVTLFNFDF